jgi:hypothetical protein
MEQRSKATDETIDIGDDAQAKRWAEHFDVDVQELKNAVKAVGPKVADVREHLKLHFHRE